MYMCIAVKFNLILMFFSADLSVSSVTGHPLLTLHFFSEFVILTPVFGRFL